ncbi:hypothetical protein ACQ3HE_16950 [Plantibacter auratus]|uniref:hypothetical protein n=1 Tax=Plantibacter auratus TaxID=272914 RepID=UPI003D342169
MGQDGLVPLRNAEPPPEPDPRLDRYRRALARVLDGDRHVGYLATTVDVRWTRTRRHFRVAHVDPYEFVMWQFMVIVDFGGLQQHGFDDGWEDTTEVRDELDRDEFAYPFGEPLKLAWADTTEVEPWAAYYPFDDASEH